MVLYIEVEYYKRCTRQQTDTKYGSFYARSGYMQGFESN